MATSTTTRRRVPLAPGALVNLDDARGTTIRVGRGRVWITQFGDLTDHVLEAGDSWAIERNGRTLVEAQNDAFVDLSGPGAAKAFLPMASTPASVEARGIRGQEARQMRSRYLGKLLRGAGDWLMRVANHWMERRWMPRY
jgi:hypothetical protein